MAGKTITQRIAFEGGQEMELQLKQLGDAGTTAFTRIKQAADNASTLGNKILPVIETIRQRLIGVADATTNMQNKFNALGESVKTVETRLLAASTAALALGAGLVALVVKTGNAADQLERNAKAAQINTQDYQELKDAFEIAGEGGDVLDSLLKRMNKTFGDSQTQALEFTKKQSDLSNEMLRGQITGEKYLQTLADNNTEAAKTVNVFNRLGVSAATAFNDPKEALKQVMFQINQMPQGIERASVELQVFGRSGVVIEPIIQSLEKLQATVSHVAEPLSKAEVSIGVKMAQAVRTLGVAADNLRLHLGAIFEPDVTELATAFTEKLVANRETILKFAESIQATIKPIIDDIVKLLNGQELGPESFVGKVRDAVVAFASDAKQAILIVVGAWQGFVAILDTIAGVFNKIFGTKITGQALALVAVIGVLTGAFSALAALFGALISVVGVLDAVLVAAFGPEAALLIGLALLGAAIGALIVQIPTVQQAFQTLVDGFSGTVANFVTLFKLIGAAWSLLWQEAGNVARSALGGVLDFISSIIDKINVAIAAMKNFFSASDGTGGQSQGFATGGKVKGPGTSRSDSIFARLSNGEFVQQAPAVTYYGERFMHALNNMQIPRSVLDGIAGFANGGMVRAASALMPVPGFASGGLVTADAIAGGGSRGRPLVLQIGDEIFTGLTAEDKTAEKLSRFATRRNIQSAGRKPSWVK